MIMRRSPGHGAAWVTDGYFFFCYFEPMMGSTMVRCRNDEMSARSDREEGKVGSGRNDDIGIAASRSHAGETTLEEAGGAFVRLSW